MDKNNLNLKFEVPAQALARWTPEIKAASKKDDEKYVAINMYSTIGDYGDGAGMTTKIVDSILRKAEGKDVLVNINSPGGDFFEGISINTLLKQYSGAVKVRVVGLAASAASIVAMAGDDIEISEGGFIMVHNAWTMAIGNKNDMYSVYTMLQKFDASMAALYAEQTGVDEKKIRKMMDDETWLSGQEAVDMGFASGLLGASEIEKVEDEENKSYNSALRTVDIELAKAGMPRSERRRLLKDLTGTPRAAENLPTPRAGFNEALSGLLTTIKTN